MNTKMNLEEKVQQWFVDRNLHEANPVKQFLKLMEESGELFEGIAKDKSELIYDALGDIQVVMIGFEQQIKNGAQISANEQELELLLMVSSLGSISQKLYSHVCHNETQTPLIKSDIMFLDSVINSVSLFNGTTAENCLDEAYNVIKDRKGKMIDGVFVKEEDLPVEDEKKYKITLLNRNDGDLYLVNQNAGVSDKYGHFSPVVLLFTKGTNFSEQCYKLTKKEVVSNGFGWVFDCPGFQIEEVEE